MREEIREHIKDTREQARVRSQKGGMVEKRVGPQEKGSKSGKRSEKSKASRMKQRRPQKARFFRLFLCQRNYSCNVLQAMYSSYFHFNLSLYPMSICRSIPFQSISICRSFLSIAVLAVYQSKAMLSDNISSDSESNSDNDSDDASNSLIAHPSGIRPPVAWHPSSIRPA